MYTQCPECLTIFEIDEEALQASLGIVHCGQCSQRFDALRSLSNTLPLDPGAPLAGPDTQPRVLTLTAAVSPAELELAASKRRRRRSKSPGASHQTPGENSPAPDADADWLANLHTDLADALIADAAGISEGERQADDSWRLLDAPVQARFDELDIIPVSPDEYVTFELEGDDPAERGIESGPDDSEAADTVGQAELLLAGLDEADPESVMVAQHAAPSPNASNPSAPAAGDDGAPADTGELAFATVDAPDLLDDAFAAIAPPAAANAPETTDAATGGAAGAEPEAGDAPAPIYVPPRRRRFSRAGVLWMLGCLVLAVTLAAQLAWAKRVALFRNPQAHPWVVRVCANLPCHIPPIRDLAKLELLSRDIRPDPHVAGALVITATLRNDASFRQPWPVVTVELSDIDGKPVAMRRFRPAEYMPDPARRAAGIAPGATAAVAFEVADPGKRAVNFEFSFQ